VTSAPYAEKVWSAQSPIVAALHSRLHLRRKTKKKEEKEQRGYCIRVKATTTLVNLTHNAAAPVHSCSEMTKSLPAEYPPALSALGYVVSECFTRCKCWRKCFLRGGRFLIYLVGGVGRAINEGGCDDRLRAGISHGALPCQTLQIPSGGFKRTPALCILYNLPVAWPQSCVCPELQAVPSATSSVLPAAALVAAAPCCCGTPRLKLSLDG